MGDRGALGAYELGAGIDVVRGYGRPLDGERSVAVEMAAGGTRPLTALGPT